MPALKIFTDLSKEERLTLFQKCQDLLVKHQPDSEWVLRRGGRYNKTFFIDVFIRYKGLVYESDDIVVLFNKQWYVSRDDIIERQRDDLWRPPHKTPNTYSIDFIASSLTKEILQELEPYFNDPGMKYVCFLRGAKLSVFNVEAFKDGMRHRFGL